ncbi:MAG TPA: Rrf2 family transcriptional regulator [Oscillospiraceae bacterium]|nr:Rrf2 family transcriptional regulator [Oscillospiraceae bacterium]HNW04421.1 Rrf2 family transcriptional regulator [Oscillospiraceae bacterium]
MMISTKGRYALRLILALAQEGGGKPLSIREISKRQEISEKYSEQIILQLSRAGLVTGLRGAQGGYTLSRPAEQITAGEVLRAAEGSIAPVECAEIGCDHSEGCMTYGLWRRIKEAVDSVVDSTTVADLLADPGPRSR